MSKEGYLGCVNTQIKINCSDRSFGSDKEILLREKSDITFINEHPQMME